MYLSPILKPSVNPGPSIHLPTVKAIHSELFGIDAYVFLSTVWHLLVLECFKCRVPWASPHCISCFLRAEKSADVDEYQGIWRLVQFLVPCCVALGGSQFTSLIYKMKIIIWP